jgi:ketosteroid isomerase-like protein
MATEGEMNGAEQVRRLYEDSENRTSKAFEELVARDSFGELLARMTENVVGLTRIGTDVFDLVLRNLRLAGRQDVTRLARQLARAEDKLELVLQEVERLHDRLDEAGRSARVDGNRRAGAEAPGAPASVAGDEGS